MPTANRPNPGHPDTERVVIDESGRLVVPARFRRALGIRGRETVVVGMVGDSLRVRTIDGALERLQRLARRKRPAGTGAVDAFIAERRQEAESE
ncbi:MAG: MraZ N-terminal domain containing protein [Gemmatimonadetes bacterium]|nr:MraZ N-terminal domain containing protein [Gemmatimonadota bacterium]